MLTGSEGQLIFDTDPKNGPLFKLTPVFVDFEMYMDKEIRLGNMTLRQYLSKSYITALSMAIGEADPIVVENDGGEEYEAVIDMLEELSQRDDVVIVAHNAAFDVRVMRFKCGIPQPKNVWCTLEGAMGAWPESPNGFSLGGLSERMRFKKPKLKFDLGKLSKYRKMAEKANLGVPILNIDTEFREQLLAVFKAAGVHAPTRVTVEDFDAALLIYTKRDVAALQELYYRERERLPPVEQMIALITNDVRKHHFEVSEERLQNLVTKLNSAARGAESKAVDILAKEGRGSLQGLFTEDDETLAEDEMTDASIAKRHIFNHETDDGELGSIRYARMKKVLHAKFNATDLESTSLKKLSPVKLAKYPSVHAFLQQSTRAGKMVYHRRKAQMFAGVDQVDVELRYMGSHTGRFSSPGAGGAKSLNLHNCVSARSRVLTKRGWVGILDITTDDLIWDGLAFVPHHGVTYEGERECLPPLNGLRATSEHPIWTHHGWTARIALTPYQQVLAAAAGYWSIKQSLQSLLCEPAAPDAGKLQFDSQRVLIALKDAEDALTRGNIGYMGAVCHQNSSSSIPPATTTWVSDTEPKGTQDLPSSGTAFTLPGKSCEPSWTTVEHCLAGMTNPLNWIESNLPETTSQETFDLWLRSITTATESLRSSWPTANSSSTMPSGTDSSTCKRTTYSDKAVFDLRGVGPRARFQCDGLIVANCPKHDKEVAQPVRELFRVPNTHCLVRADFANVELRVEGILTGCQAIIKMFDPASGGDPLTDPYVAGWKNMTRIEIDKKTEKGKNMRQLSKAAHLALGFCQSAAGFTSSSLLKAIASGDTSEEALREIIRELQWYPPKYGMTDIMEKLGCSQTVALAAYHIHRAFNEAHPEFRRAADWLYRCVEEVAKCNDVSSANRRLERMRESSSAMSPDMCYLYAEISPEDRHPSIRAKCGPWVPTVCWREPLARPFGPVGASDMRLSVRKANGRFKTFTKQLAIENITQAAARNQLCWGILELKKLGYDDIFHVHDEIMLLVPKTPECALGARQALTDVFGPDAKGKPLSWATLLKPSEISITQSLWEDEKDLVEFYEDKKTKQMLPGGNRWYRIEHNLPGCLDNLT